MSDAPHRMRLRNGLRELPNGEIEHTYGEYVLASDYDALRAERDALRRYRDDMHDTFNTLADILGGADGADGVLAKTAALRAERDQYERTVLDQRSDLERMTVTIEALSQRLADLEAESGVLAGGCCAVLPARP